MPEDGRGRVTIGQSPGVTMRIADRSCGLISTAGRTEIVGGQATDQNNISLIVSWEIDNGARHGEVVQSD
jgi:hypothetical protein